jgi:hypothetical protein
MGIVRTGLYSFFAAATTSSLYSLLDGARLYYDEAPEKTKRPYCVFFVYNEIYEGTFDLDFENVLIQFAYYGRTANESDSGITAIKTLYDYANITLSGYTCIRLERDYAIPPSKIQPDDIWEGIIRYTLLMLKK